MNLHYLNPMFAFRGYRPYKIVPIDGPSFIALVAKDITLTKNRTYTFRGTQDVVVLQKSDNIEQVSCIATSPIDEQREHCSYETSCTNRSAAAPKGG